MTDSTSSHPPRDRPDASTHSAPLGFTSSSSSSTTELPRLKVKLQQSLRQFPDFPAPGVLFEDILPIFRNPLLHETLITALELYIHDIYGPKERPDIIIGLEARGFLFGPSLALRLGAGFVPIRKKGKLPGPVETASYTKEYGEDHFQIQSDSIKKGQTVLIVDDIIATGGTAAAAESLIEKLEGVLLGHVFILELGFLNGRAKLNAPVHTLLTGQNDDSHPE